MTRQSQSRSVSIARCPEHGLHGERTECFVCDGPVEQVPMVPCDDAAVERAMDALEASDSDYRYVTRRDIRETVEAIFRAAGDTP